MKFDPDAWKISVCRRFKISKLLQRMYVFLNFFDTEKFYSFRKPNLLYYIQSGWLVVGGCSSNNDNKNIHILHPEPQKIPQLTKFCYKLFKCL